MKYGMTMLVEVEQRDITDVAWNADALVDREQECLEAWRAADDPDRRRLEQIVRMSLRRLLDNPGWIPGAARLVDSRLEVRLVVELDDLQLMGVAAAAALEDEVAEVRRRLPGLRARLDALPDDDG